jgi:hypothetical protein
MEEFMVAWEKRDLGPFCFPLSFLRSLGNTELFSSELNRVVEMLRFPLAGHPGSYALLGESWPTQPKTVRFRFL